MAGESVCLEITESVVVQDIETTRITLAALKEVGVQIAIDDFGTGYSVLSHLKSLPVDTLKIDRSFVRDLGTNAGDLAIVRAVIALADAFGLEVVAEGVETDGRGADPAATRLPPRAGLPAVPAHRGSRDGRTVRPASGYSCRFRLRCARRPDQSSRPDTSSSSRANRLNGRASTTRSTVRGATEAVERHGRPSCVPAPVGTTTPPVARTRRSTLPGCR